MSLARNDVQDRRDKGHAVNIGARMFWQRSCADDEPCECETEWHVCVWRVACKRRVNVVFVQVARLCHG